MRSEKLHFLFSPVSRIKGVGPSASETLKRLLPQATQRAGGGLPLVRDVLFHLPIGVVDRRVSFALREAPEGVVATFIVKVDAHYAPANNRFSRKPYKVVCSNETGTLTLVFFNASSDYIKQSLPVGEQRVISGVVEHFDGMAQMTHPDIIAPLYKLEEVQKLEPVYPLTAGLTSKRVAKIVEGAMEKMPDLGEWLSTSSFPLEGGGLGGGCQANSNLDVNHPHPNPPPLRGRETVLSFKQALLAAHHPQVPDDVLPTSPAHQRLAYDEIFAHQLQLALLRQKMQAQPGITITGNGTLTKPLLASLPFALTNGQQQVLAEIEADMASGKRMTRMLQGDVGSGKTIVALLAMLRAVEAGYQCALMVPTELVARQHYQVIHDLVRIMNHESRITILTGSVTGRERAETLEKIASGEAKIIIGTHALFQDKVTFHNLALVVIDEQHRFGVAQRMALTQKGQSPHILHMTATPIPRSLTMLLYGDMDCSMLKEKPANRLPIATRLIPKSRYEEVLQRLQAALDRGEKAYWICPLVEDSGIGIQDSGDTDVAAAQTRFKEFTARFGDIVSMAHGRMKADERNMQMQKFASGETKLLVATTVVEVGVDVKDATIMVIEEAQRFGLSQLHQLRGRVGRGDKQSACVLLYSEDSGFRIQDSAKNTSPNPEPRILSPSLERLDVLKNTEDGFLIAEEDLKLRGGGELLGTRQSGAERSIFLDLSVHAPLIAKARDEAKALLASDPDLKSERGQAAQLLLQLFEREVN